jgi:hypothetical protein
LRINAVSPSIVRRQFLDKTTSAELLDRLSAREAFRPRRRPGNPSCHDMTRYAVRGQQE